MLTFRENIEEHRLQRALEACQIGAIAAGAVAVLCLVISLCGGPAGLTSVAVFEGIVSLGCFATWRRLRRRQRQLAALA